MRLSPSDIIVQELLEPAVKSLTERAEIGGTTAGTVFFEYAAFCTAQLEDQQAIADIKRMETLHKNKQEESNRYIDAIRDAERRDDRESAKAFSRDRERAQKLQRMDKTELQRLYNLQQTFLRNAIENFLRCFAACSDYDHYVPKFCAIWLKNTKQKGLNSIAGMGLHRVSSYKFLPLMHQLCSRLSSESNEFQVALTELIFRILTDHPFHSVHQVFSSMSSVGDSVANSRSLAARGLIEKLKQTSSGKIMATSVIVGRLVDQFAAYSEFASLPVNKRVHPNNEVPLSAYPSLRKFRSKVMVEDMQLPPPSLVISISPERNYSNVPYIQKYRQTFRLAGGVNQPKILESVLSNGKSFRELVEI